MADNLETPEITQDADGLDNNPTYCIKAVRIFMAGTYRKTKKNEAGEDEVIEFKYDNDDLTDMCEAFNTFCTGKNAVYETPVVVGHEQNQDILDLTGLPSAGWIRKLWTQREIVNTPVLPIDGLVIDRRTIGSEETFLMAYIGGMPKLAAQWIKDGKYRYVSAEISEAGRPPPGVPVQTKFLLRLAILGATPPHVKALGPLPKPVLEDATATYSQQPGNTRRVGFWIPNGSLVCFSEERTPMNETLKKALMEQGVPEEQATQMASGDAKKFAGLGKAFADAGAPTVEGGGSDSGFDRTAAIEKLASLPDSDRDTLSKMSDEELQAMLAKNGFADSHQENGGVTTAPGSPEIKKGVAGSGTGTNTTGYADKEADQKFSQAKAMLTRSEELARQSQADYKKTLALLSSDTKTRHAAIKKARVEEIGKFCDGLVKEHKVMPSEIASIRSMLEIAADQPETTVVKFSQDGKDEDIHPFALLKKQLLARSKLPIALFSQDGALAPAPTVDEAAKSRAQKMMKTSMTGQEVLAKKAKK